MKTYLVVFLGLTAVILLGGVMNMGTDTPLVPYPDGYRSWTHVKTLLLLPGHPLYEGFGGMHHIYANDKAAEVLRKGGNHFPDGSILVFDLFEAPQQDNAISEGARKVTAVMLKRAKAYKETGGWGFEAFKGNSRERIVTDPVTQCYNCHAGQAQRDYVFSQWRP
ncbi:MAG: cytochrome P460 family protein [Bacteroidota bacterium]|nr:cytochrome P460 family protein [Candidatus Kapabacteria bacterium]MCS7303151.1 cytochrome P460 family protein [Candidatus Kapabacteria bacterium]MDW8075727.1 cytochrome P460 family protein [Bacteroidota bacterium]MDW8272051.1 cytochrome P460 family protein [Bacteroidota bacterium]